MNNNMRVKEFTTSHYCERLKFEINERELILSSIPCYQNFDEIIIHLYNENLNLSKETKIRRTNPKLTLSTINAGRYFMDILIEDKYGDNQFTPVLSKNIMLEINDKDLSFVLPLCTQLNQEFIDKIPTSLSDLGLYKVSTSGIDAYTPEIIKLAKEITIFSHNAYHSLLCIHDWIAKNLYYDTDSLTNNGYLQNKHSALNAIRCRNKCVCSDFTYLTLALCRALKIPSIGILCKTDSKGKLWDDHSMKDSDSWHIFAAAWTDNRWILMDNTWDCFNQIKNGVYQPNSSGYGKKYFDPTIELLSSSHIFTGIQI